jgi:2-oxoglutarate dehydrogenase E2 component (dihydrolipoamide succinyltransferase)
MAVQETIDLRLVKGSGLGGRITKQDLQNYLNDRELRQAVPGGEVKASLIPHTPIRRQIAEHMRLSKQTSPHVTTMMEADLSRVVAHRQEHKPGFAEQGVNLTFTAYFLLVTASALRAYPNVNSSWMDEGILIHGEINLGMATSLGEEGLIVPVIHKADTLPLLEMARSINDLATRARLHQLKPEEVKGGTFTVTNHGISGSLFASPIINQPQCAILGIGAIQKRVVVISAPDGSDLIAIRPMVYLSLTFDHRILDGEKADEFLMKVVKSLENFQ